MPNRITRGGRLALPVALSMALPATAQQTGAVELPPIIVQSKRNVATDSAASVTQIDGEEIADRVPDTIAEIVDSVPGVTLVNGGTPSGSGINIRGFGANGTYGTDQKVLIQIDGASVGSEELYRIGTQLYTDPALFREVEVVRGIAGTLEYGSGAVGGLVRLDTIDASDLTGGDVGYRIRQGLQYSSNGDGLTSSTTLGWQLSDRWEFLANYTWREQDDQDDGSGTTINNSASATPSSLFKIRGQITPDQSLTLTYTETSASDRDVPYDSFSTVGGAFGNVDRDIDSSTAALTWDYDPASPLVQMQVQLTYASQTIDQQYIEGSSAFAPPGGYDVVNADHDYETTKLTVRNTAQLTTGAVGHDLRTAVELSRRDRLDANSAPGGQDDRIALFAVDDMRFGSGTTLTPALRYESQRVGNDAAGDFDNDALMGALTVLQEVGGGVSVFASAAYTESLPIIDDLDPASANFPVYMETSEKARTFEVGASWDRGSLLSSGDQLEIRANAYTTALWDVTSYSGVTGVDLDGFELEASYSHGSGFYVDLNGNIQDGKARDSEELWRGIPADDLRVTLGKRWGEALDVSWEVHAAAEVEDAAVTSPGYAVHNLRATWRPELGSHGDDLEVRLAVENAFDRDYTPHLATRPAEGRNILVGLTKTF
ncbi:TonB-dependent receptor domain-containing protein [Pseudoroseicyclus aestuarii]|uniref:Hemoglobin/transferrin/lactoferrin receptor protein n=1 Tax=Pseudoroseicyclus aestuarii TaxID=1795041 RepID=A0A318SSF5_9RHOB|nr:TonB-dependent receptor [Pseudoroseicyclus aestuarii]PYE81316.1 hemoglobin/transferrin/lactoferrin receptor protein [Pseudoroseicyclus aestuarii]